jgi:hypothetical protein
MIGTYWKRGCAGPISFRHDHSEEKGLPTEVHHMGFEVITAVRMTMFFYVVAPCTFVGRYQRFGETQCLHLQD